MSRKPKDPCKPFACAIQDCLKGHNFQESACEQVIENLRDCCRKWKDKSLVCSGMLERPASVDGSNHPDLEGKAGHKSNKLLFLIDITEQFTTMEIIKKSRSRLRSYPQLLVECRLEGSAYATCVAQEGHMQKGSCQVEFEKFKQCLVKAAAKLGTRL
ncbi:Cx9C motif-containing protein 4 [Frankliniella fusca]|uniref:Cx9C motif-containing protein 4 n=1 Tax=Frankliniella fusca TaxID=407009 RepID=A0AAE1LAQ1_9NEOP|nr:Cx9C motif-containing protein 4 [Frankliniella fusca]